jgi:sterol desaturase/sphingolipid hydroxylase (fatty acid hydroxylase superfamily)
MPTALWFATTFVAANVIFYWHHRLSHRCALLWRFHAVHHSSAQLDWLAGVRIHPVEGLTAGLMVAPLFGLVDVRPYELGVLNGALALWGILLHANVRWRLRWLDRFLVTPEYHHWHHERSVLDRNFAGVLPVLDTVFGTRHVPGDARPAVYGVDDAVPQRWWAQMRWPFAGLRADRAAAAH